MASVILAELRHMPEAMLNAEYSAVKKTQKTAKTKIVRTIWKDHVNLKRAVVEPRVKTLKHAKKGSAYAVISLSNKRISLWQYSRSKADMVGFRSQRGKKMSERKPKRGAGWKVWKDGKRLRHKRFIATTGRRSRKEQIIERDPLSTNSGMLARPPEDYKTKYGPSLAWLAERRKIVEPVLDEIAPILEKNLRSQVDRFLKRKKSQRPNA